MKKRIHSICLVILTVGTIHAQVAGTEHRYVNIGSLQSYFSAYGTERAWNGYYYEGLKWPANYSSQDNAVIKRAWVAVKDFTDTDGTLVGDAGFYISISSVDQTVFPMVLKQTAKFNSPAIIVNGIWQIGSDVIDEINPGQAADRVITNVINTSLGLTITRRIHVFSQQYHDNYFIKEFILTNTGNVDYDADIELTDSLKAVRIGWGTRYNVCREGLYSVGATQQWGKHTWISKRGEDYSQHLGEQFTEADAIQHWLRAGFCYVGQNSAVPHSTIGGPYLDSNGRLTSPQHAGTAIIHASVSATDNSDDPNQPAVLGWHAGDTYPTGINQGLYEYLSGTPYGAGKGGQERFDETYMTDYWVDPSTVHGDGGGTNLWICYGPYDIAHGDSVVIVEAEGINGLSRQKCETVGQRWKQAYEDPNDHGPFDLPDGSVTTDKEEYKNSWVFTGRDSIMLTFGRAKRNYENNYQIPATPLPPASFAVESDSDHIALTWQASPSEVESDFAGYKIFRSSNLDTVFEAISALPPGITSFIDSSVEAGKYYYYALVSYNDGSNNTEGLVNPTGPLNSSFYLTKTRYGACLLQSTAIEAPNPNTPNSYGLRQNYPNPFNPITTISYKLPERSDVQITIYDLQGKEITTLVSEIQEAGFKSVQWDASNISSGVYFYQIRTGEFIQTKKMVLLK